MASSLKQEPDSHLRLVSDEEPAVFPDDARPSDDCPTVISKTNPIVEPISSSQNKIVDLARKTSSPESIVAGLRGRKLAHFELLEPIGVGGMAAVIRARDTQLDRLVALKILPPEMAKEPDNVSRFHQEAKAAAKLDHENIARVFFCGEDQGLHFIAFEFVEGMNLRTMLERRGRLPLAEAVRYTLQIAVGLEHAASRGVVHRDVKPSNIIVTPTGHAKLVDMGLARNMERRADNDLTHSGMTLGTFDYISPEQALEPREADSRSDVYSLGCTLYHMLTGQPPVPEGTPAKKLHHHQHSAPLDPRNFDPSIPDELVRVLSRMMAKNPKSRYQRPIQLVHHLTQLGPKIGLTDGLPEVVMLGAAPPDQPRNRPVLIVGLALAALVAFVLLLSFVPDQTPRPTFAPTPVSSAKKGQPANGALDQVSQGKGVTADARKSDVTPITNAEQLRKLLEDDTSAEVRAVIKDTIDLGSEGLVFHSKNKQKLIIESADKQTRTIRFHYNSANSPFALLVEGADLDFKGIRFDVECETTPDRPAGAVLIRGASQVSVSRCQFLQSKARPIAPDGVPMSSILVEGGTGAEPVRPLVLVDASYFPQGQVGMAISGPADIRATNCAFKEHGAFVHLRDRCDAGYTSVRMLNSAGFVTQGPAFRVDESASVSLNVAKSWFSRPEGPAAPSDQPQPDFVFLAGDRPIQFVGRDNLYDGLNALVEIKSQTTVRSREDFQKFLAKINGSDTDSIYDPASKPFQNVNPMAVTVPACFQLRVEYQDRIGLQNWLGNAMPRSLRSLTKLDPVPPAMPSEKIVDAEAVEFKPGVFSNLQAALAEAKDGDVILIKCGEDRKVTVRPVEIKSGISVTIKAHQGYRPMLLPDKTSRDRDLFCVKQQDGAANFEGLEFVLDPSADAGFATQSIVHLGETAQCRFKNCLITLRATGDTQLNVATFLDPSLMTKMDVANPIPAKVEFHDCFIRGKGDAVALRGCRLLHVEMRNSLVALAGSLLDVEAGGKDLSTSQGVRWKMERSSIYTTEPVFYLKSPGGKGLTVTQADLEGCLLASLMPDQMIVQVDVMRQSENVDKRFLKWTGKDDFYANFLARQVFDWKEQYPETGSQFAPLTFPNLSDETRQTLWDATPDWFAPAEAEREAVRPFGLSVDALKRLREQVTPADEDP